MANQPAQSIIRIPKPDIRSLVAAPVRAQSYRNLVYLAFTFPLGLAYFIFLALGLSLGAGFSILGVGIPLLLAVLLASHGLAHIERLQARYLLGVDVVQPTLLLQERTGLWERVKGLVLDDMTYRSVFYLASKLAVGVASFTLIVTGAVTSTVFLAVPLFYDRPGVHVGIFPGGPIRITSEVYVPWDDLLVGVETAFQITELRVDTLPEALVMSGFGIVLFVLSLNVLNALAWLAGEYTRVLLGDTRLRGISVEVAGDR